MQSYPEMLNRLISTNLFYFKSNWVDIRAAAPMFIGKPVLLPSCSSGFPWVSSPQQDMWPLRCPGSAFPLCWEGTGTSRAAGNSQVLWCLRVLQGANLRLAVPRPGDRHVRDVPRWCHHLRNVSPATCH